MVFRDKKEVGSGHLEQIGMQQLSKSGCTRVLDSRLEQSPIAHSGDAAELLELKRVNLEHFLEVQERGRD